MWQWVETCLDAECFLQLSLQVEASGFLRSCPRGHSSEKKTTLIFFFLREAWVDRQGLSAVEGDRSCCPFQEVYLPTEVSPRAWGSIISSFDQIQRIFQDTKAYCSLTQCRCLSSCILSFCQWIISILSSLLHGLLWWTVGLLESCSVKCSTKCSTEGSTQGPM